MRKTCLLGSVALSFLAVPGVQAQTNTTQGAALGGIAGAVVGGIIGHQNDEVPEGALIGGAVGAIAGGVLGHSRDQQMSRPKYYQQQPYVVQQRHYQVQETIRPGVSTNDVVSMVRSGVSDQVIVNHVNTNGVQRRLQTSDIISLSQQGVSEYVIHSMQHARIAGGSTPTYHQPPVYSNPGTVIVREEVYQPGSVQVYHPVPTYAAPPYHSHKTYYRRGF